MTSLIIKTLDFSKETFDSREISCTSSLQIESAKSVAYAIRWQLASRRAGSAKTKTMAEVSGTTAKPWKQKGTGRARQGSRRSVQFVGGRTCHGPMPRSFDFSMPKKIVTKALTDVLKMKLKKSKVVLFSGFSPEIKTSKFNSILTKNNVASVLILHSDKDVFLVRAVKNLKNIKALNIKALNVYDMLSYDILMTSSEIFENKILMEVL